MADIGKEKHVRASIYGEEEEFRAEAFLVASGRRPNSQGWRLERWPLTFGPKGQIQVDENLQAAENVWAAEDVIGEPMLETVAAREGMIAAHNALSIPKIRMDYRVVPHAIFTDPQLASVGLTDEKAVEEGFRCQCHTIAMEVVPKAQAIAETKGAIKMVTQNAREILGIPMLAHSAADLIQEGAMIIRNRMTVDEVIQTLHAFPTFSEAIKLAAQSFRRDVENMTCCAE